MSVSRLLSVTVLAVALILPIGVMSTAADGAGLPHRHFTYAKIVKLPNGDLSFRAQVANYPNGYIALMKKNCKSCTWFKVATRKTTKFGRIFMPVQAPPSGRWYWRYRTPATKHFALTYSSTWYTFRR